MKKLILFLFCSALLWSQGTPNCTQALTLTTAGAGAALNTTTGATAGCAGWRLTWAISGLISAAQIQIEGSQDNSTFNAFSGALVIEGSNPTNWTSSTVSNTIVVRASLPYVRVNVTSVTSTGAFTIKTVLYGYSGTSAQNDTGGGGGGPTGPAGGDLAGSYPDPQVFGIDGVPLCNGFTPSANDQILVYTTLQTPNPCYSIEFSPNSALLTYYFTDTASDISTYLQATAGPYSPKTTLTYSALPNGTDTLQNFATNPGIPNLTSIPAGVYLCHVHALKSPFGAANLQCQIVEVNAAGVDIAVIGTTEQTNSIAQTETEYTLEFADGDVYTLASASSRIVCRVQAVVTSGAPNVELFVGGEADSHLSLPSNTVDATNFVPYLGATNDLNLGTHNIFANNLSQHFWPWQAVAQASVTGTNLWLPSTNALILTNCVSLGSCTATAGSSIRGELQATTNQNALYAGLDIILPSWYTSGAAISWAVNYETNDTTAGHTPKIVFTSACITVGLAADNPTYGNSDMATLAVPAGAYYLTTATGTYTPGACAAGSILSMLLTPDTTTGPVAAPGLLMLSGWFLL